MRICWKVVIPCMAQWDTFCDAMECGDTWELERICTSPWEIFAIVATMPSEMTTLLFQSSHQAGTKERNQILVPTKLNRPSINPQKDKTLCDEGTFFNNTEFTKARAGCETYLWWADGFHREAVKTSMMQKHPKQRVRSRERVSGAWKDAMERTEKSLSRAMPTREVSKRRRMGTASRRGLKSTKAKAS